MPTYGYRCKACSYEFEELEKISDEPLVQCPSCKEMTLVRIIGGGAGLVFKGSGFYLTDYKKSSQRESKKSPAPKESKSEVKAEPKSAAPPPAKSDDDSSSSKKD